MQLGMVGLLRSQLTQVRASSLQEGFFFFGMTLTSAVIILVVETAEVPSSGVEPWQVPAVDEPVATQGIESYVRGCLDGGKLE